MRSMPTMETYRKWPTPAAFAFSTRRRVPSTSVSRVWLQARRMRRAVVPLPLPTAWAEGYRRGYNTCPDRKVGKITWAEWVRRKYK